MKKLFLSIFVILTALTAHAATVQTYDDGLGNISWSTDGGASSCGCTPADGDDIIVNHAITLAGNFTLESGSITINNGGALTVSPGDLQIGPVNPFGSSASLIINSGGSLDVADDLFTYKGTFTVAAGADVNVGDTWLNGGLMDPVIDGNMAVGGDLFNLGAFGFNGDITGTGNITVDGNVSNFGTIGGSTDDDLGTLPVNVVYFIGETNNAFQAELMWATATEENFDYFTIERSANGIDFEEAGTVDGFGESNSILTYRFFDENSIEGTAYYRLKATDIDGFEEYHGVVRLEGKKITQKGSVMEFYPNPNNGRDITVVNNFEGLTELVVIDLNGREMHRQMIEFGNNKLQFDQLLQKGNYVISIRTIDNVYSEHLMVR